jgi:predicted cupin superfamily sugar epimerase
MTLYVEAIPGDPTVQQQLIKQLQLVAHPEGGFYRETYRSDATVARVEPAGAGMARSASTAIYYLLCDGAYSAWHRIKSDEVWHFYAGGVLAVHVLDPLGHCVTHRLGNPLVHGAAVGFQAVVPAGCWFAAECSEAHAYALAGCTVAPGFEFSEFELADPQVLQRNYPAHRALIARLGHRAGR